MRFLLRCMFVLSIVYAAILRQGGYIPDFTASVAQALPGAEAAAGRGLVVGIGTVCDRTPSACLAAAAKLGGMLGTSADAAPASGGRPARHRDEIGPASPYMGR